MEHELLETKILETRNSLSTDRLDMSFGEIMSMYEREEIIINPDFQRLFRWSISQQTRFIESLLLGIPIPPIFVAEDSDGRWELVDGLQRLSTIFSYFGLLKDEEDKNNWVLEKGDLVEELEGFDIDKLPIKYQLNIKRASCRVEIIKWNSKIDMRYELFNRLNTGGSPLADQEIRNCIFRGVTSQFNDLLKRASNHDRFLELLSLTDRQKSMLYNEELVLRFVALFNKAIDKDLLSSYLTNYMKEVIEDNSFDYGMEDLFYRVVNVLYPFGKTIFRFNNGSFSTSLYDAIFIGTAKNIDYYEKNTEDLKSRIITLSNDDDFRKYTGSASNSKSRVQNRIIIAEKIFKVE